MLQEFWPILLFIGVATAIGIVPIIAGSILGPKKPYAEKLAPYECGFSAFNDARIPFDVRFYLVAILFILFDLETAFFVPWAVVMRKIGWPGLIAMGFFLFLLLLGFIYEWKKGALEWE
ncbi:MAG: NADH-quinone oxidoreductase subunit A [Legionellales bacterium]|nr:NADH-quinone oxidoreductase subunit A [Legionellales bacterium]